MKVRYIKRIGIVHLTFVAVLAASVAGLRLYHRNFYRPAHREFVIPALESGFVPQGFTGVSAFGKQAPSKL